MDRKDKADVANICPSVAGIKCLCDRHNPESTQIALANFLESSSYETRLRRLETRFKNNRVMIMKFLKEQLPKFGELWTADYGSHLAFVLRHDLVDVEISKKLEMSGMIAKPLSRFSTNHSVNGLVIGFQGYSREKIEAALNKMRSVFLRKTDS